MNRTKSNKAANRTVWEQAAFVHEGAQSKYVYGIALFGWVGELARRTERDM